MTASTDWKRDRIRSALRGENPSVMARLPAGFAVFGDTQFLPGYSLLLSDDPDASQLIDLEPAARIDYLASVELLARIVGEVCADIDPRYRRINIEILGNIDEFLHTHVWPRYHWEPDDHRNWPVWGYPSDRWRDDRWQAGPQHERVRSLITERLRPYAT